MTPDGILYKEILNKIDEATLPETLSKEEAIEFLEQLNNDILDRIGELEDEIAELK